MNDYRILVVDDEEDLCEILKFNLENEGYFVDTANSAEEALKMELTRYDLLLLDVMMGEISGFKMANMTTTLLKQKEFSALQNLMPFWNTAQKIVRLRQSAYKIISERQTAGILTSKQEFLQKAKKSLSRQ